MPSLVLNTPTKKGPGSFTLEKPITSIGSTPDNDIPVDFSGVAESHALIHFDGSTFSIQPVKRSTPVLINGKKRRKHVLKHQDVVEIGDARMIFDMHEGTSRQGGLDEEESAKLGFELTGYRRLQSFAEQLLGEYELGSLLENMMDAVIEITRADKGFLIIAEGEDFNIRVARNIDRETIDDAVAHVSDSIIAKVISTRQALIVSDALQHTEFKSAQSVINLQLSSVMCAPLVHKGNLIGVIYVGNENIANLFERRHLDLLGVFASQASLILANAILVNDLKLDKKQLTQKLQGMRFGSIIGACDAMREIFTTIDKVAPTNVNVLVLGETGTGKELIANEIHNRSPRANKPFVTLNCGAIPESLLESELFGHVKGAFTGASATREGKFQAADGGTIFLDEIGEMPLNLQVKLLRVLQERTITKVGATKSESVDIRVVAATNINLETAVKEGKFRDDLYYRLNVVQMRLPPLRQRGDDVVLIARYLINKVCDELRLPPKELGAEAIQALKKFEWPGNIRQLENRLKKAIVLADSAILTPGDLDLSPEVLQETLPLADAKERFAYNYIMEALERNGGNRTQTAKELGVDPRTIFRYLEKELDETT